MKTSSSIVGAGAAYFFLTLFAVLAGSSYVISRLILADGYAGSIGVSSIGVVFSTLGFIALDRPRSELKLRRVDLVALTFAGLSIFCAPFLILEGSKSVSPSLAAALVVSNAIFIALFARFLGRKRFTPRQVGAITLGFAGVMAVSFDQGLARGDIYGVAVLIAAAISIALTTIIFESSVIRLGALRATKLAFIVASAPTIFVALGFGLVDFTDTRQIALGALFGILGLGGPVVAFNEGMRRLGSADAATFKLLVPFFAFAYGYFFFDETPGVVSAVAAISIVGALALYHRG